MEENDEEVGLFVIEGTNGVQIKKAVDGTFKVQLKKVHKNTEAMRISGIKDWKTAHLVAKNIAKTGYRGVLVHIDSAGNKTYESYVLVQGYIRTLGTQDNLKKAAILADLGLFTLSVYSRRVYQYNTEEFKDAIKTGKGFSTLGVSLVAFGDIDHTPGIDTIMREIVNATKQEWRYRQSTKEHDTMAQESQRWKHTSWLPRMKTSATLPEVKGAIMATARSDVTDLKIRISSLSRICASLLCQNRFDRSTQAANQILKMKSSIVRCGMYDQYQVLCSAMVIHHPNHLNFITSLIEDLMPLIPVILDFDQFSGLSQSNNINVLKRSLVDKNSTSARKKNYSQSSFDALLLNSTWLKRSPGDNLDPLAEKWGWVFVNLIMAQFRILVKMDRLTDAMVEMTRFFEVQGLVHNPELNSFAGYLHFQKSVLRDHDHERLDDLKSSEDCFKRAIAADPHNPVLIEYLTEIHLNIMRLVGVSNTQIASQIAYNSSEDSDDSSQPQLGQSQREVSDGAALEETFATIDRFCEAHPNHPAGFRQMRRLLQLQLLMTDDDENGVQEKIDETMALEARCSLCNLGDMTFVLPCVFSAIDCLTFDQCPGLYGEPVDPDFAMELWTQLSNCPDDVFEKEMGCRQWWKYRFFERGFEKNEVVSPLSLAILKVGTKARFM